MRTRSPLNFYERRIFPWLNDRLTRTPDLERLRAEALAPATGRVLEIGFGSGSNLAHYPSAVTSIVALDPNDGMHELAGPKVHASRIPVRAFVGEAEQIPLNAGVIDTVVSTLTLCTVTDPQRVLAEVRRVLGPGGRALWLEHGLSDDPGVARWQQRLNGIQNLAACGCNLNRSIPDLVTRAGFEWLTIRRFYAAGVPRTHGWFTLGVARVNPSAPAPVQ